MTMQRKMVVTALTALLMVACKGRKHEEAYYMAMVDSIRKAEQVKQIEEKAGLRPKTGMAWFDSLQLRTLPIQSAGDDLVRLGEFVDVPMNVNEHFGYAVSAKLKAMALPTAYRRPVFLLAEMVDSITPRLFLYTMDRRYQPIDQLTLYERKAEKREDDRGTLFMEYYITSKYEITVMLYYQSDNRERKPELLNSRRYIINRDGLFEETIIELE